MQQNYTTRATLPVIRREGRLWVVLAIMERDRLRSYTLDCVSLDGQAHREDFTAGATEVRQLREATVTMQVAIPPRGHKPCPQCGGLGRVGDAPCDVCRGSGNVKGD